jgi:uncharacterized membrane protein
MRCRSRRVHEPAPNLRESMSGVTTSDVRPAGPEPAVRSVGYVRANAWTIAVWSAMFGWTVVLFAVVRDAFLEFRLGRFDLGNMVQAVWSTAQGRPLDVTQSATGEQVSRLAGHVDPFLVLLSPLWLVWPSPLALAFAQVLVVSLGALPVFWLGRRHLGSERAAGLLALGYLAYPWVATSAVGAIHPVTFAIPLLLLGVWFLDTDRLLPFGVCAVFVMSTGELMGLPVAGLGVWYALARRRRLAGGVIALAGMAWTFLAVYVIVRRFADGDSIFFGFYEHVGGSPDGVVRTLFSDPGVVLSALFEAHDVVYLVWLGLPLLFLFVLSPGLAAVALPQLLANTLSDFRSMSDPRYHSVAAVIPFLIAATVFAIARFDAHRRTIAAAAVLTCSATLALVVGPWARAIGQKPLGGRESVPAARVDALRDAIALVPDGVPVSSSNSVGAHLSARERVYSVPMVAGAEWVVIDRGDPWVVRPDSPLLTNHPEIVRALAERLERDATWRAVFDREGVVVFRKRGGE